MSASSAKYLCLKVLTKPHGTKQPTSEYINMTFPAGDLEWSKIHKRFNRLDYGEVSDSHVLFSLSGGHQVRSVKSLVDGELYQWALPETQNVLNTTFEQDEKEDHYEDHYVVIKIVADSHDDSHDDLHDDSHGKPSERSCTFHTSETFENAMRRKGVNTETHSLVHKDGADPVTSIKDLKDGEIYYLLPLPL